MKARFTALAAVCLAMTTGCGTSSTMTSTTPLTRAEQSRFEDTSRYADVRAFIDALVTQTPRVRVEMFGRSEEGRDLPLLVIGDPPAATPPARTDARVPVVFVMANIHAGEVEGKEAVLHLARRLTVGDLQPLLRSAVWLFAPIYNADGNERVSLDNRTEQYGPIGGVGTRENARGLDLNRDFMKLESSEARALVSLFTRWDPDVIVDLHTTNGSYHGYHLTYAPQLNPNADPTLTAYVRDRLLPTVRNAMTSRHQWRTYDYGNFTTADAIDDELEGFASGETRQKVWRTYDARPRFGNNYIGLRNRIAVLSEAYSYLSFERRVKATEAFVEEIMRFVSGTGGEIRTLTTRSDAESSAGLSESGVAFALQALPKPVDILVGAIGLETNPRSGKPMRTMIESTATPTSMTVYDRFGVTVTRPVPREYVLRPSADDLHQSIGRLLRAHGVAVDELSAPKRMAVDRFVVSEIRHNERLFQGHHETAIAGRFERGIIDVPAGSLVVRTNQPLSRLVFYLMEPESNDGLTTWNFMDGALKPGTEHPVLKSAP
jgi:hypothetical protein